MDRTYKDLKEATVAIERVHVDENMVLSGRQRLTEAADGQTRELKPHPRHSRFSAGTTWRLKATLAAA